MQKKGLTSTKVVDWKKKTVSKEKYIYINLTPTVTWYNIKWWFIIIERYPPTPANKNNDGLGKVSLTVNECQELFSVEASKQGRRWSCGPRWCKARPWVCDPLGLLHTYCYIPISCQATARPSPPDLKFKTGAAWLFSAATSRVQVQKIFHQMKITTENISSSNLALSNIWILSIP